MSARTARSAGFRGRAGLPAALAVALLGAGCGGDARQPSAAGEQSNLVLVTVSSLRADHLGIYGYPRNITPRLDLFAASGAVFLAAVTPWPETGRAAAAVLTGMDPARIAHGAPARLLPGRGLPITLREHGYRTLAAVSHPALAAELGFRQGFDAFEEHWSLPGRQATEAVLSFGLEALADPGPSAPLFLWLHFSAPAPPHDPPEEDLAALAGDGLTPDGPRFREGAAPLAATPGGPDYGEAVDRYDAAIRSVDRAVGRLLDGVTGGAAAGRTLVAFAGLHGESLGEHTPPFAHPRPLFRETLDAPLLLGWPGAGDERVPAAVRVGATVGLADLAPTVLALIGVPAATTAPAGTTGKPLVGVLEGTEVRPHRRLYAQSGSELFAVFDGRLRLVRIPAPGGAAPQFGLFNLIRDPNEAENRFQTGSAVEPLRAQLETRRIQTVAWGQANERESGGGEPLSAGLAAALARREER